MPNTCTSRAVWNDLPALPASPVDSDLIALVDAAAAGDQSAWTALVRRFDARLRAIARSYRLSPSDVDDVVQATWLKLLEHIGDIRNPSAILWWLTTTTRRNALGALQLPVRERVTDDPNLGDGADTNGPEAALLDAERRDALNNALQTLPDRHRALMTAFATQPTIEYAEISEQLSIPRGSIGPIRARSLTRLARHPQLLALR